jgi:hypothetical protein
VESKIPGFNRIKTGLFIPFWMADLHFYGLEYGEGKKGCFWGPGFFGERLVLVQPRVL